NHCWDPCGACCGPRSMFWVRGEYVAWSATHDHVPALVTRSDSGLARNLPVNSGNSTVLYDESNLPDNLFNGGRVALGFWFPRHCDWGLDVSYLYLGERRGSFAAGSDGNPALGRPFFNVNNNSERAEV